MNTQHVNFAPGVRRLAVAGALLLLGAGTSAWAVQPDAKTVPWVPANPLTPHTILDNVSTTLKGASSIADGEGDGPVVYTWNPGDGSPVTQGAVTNKYAIELSHTYNGTPGTVFVAQLTVEDQGTGETDTANYLVQVADPTLEAEVNIAIDEGLWYLHKRMNRFGCSTAALDCGTWENVSLPSSTIFPVIDPINTTAFLVNGHAESGDASNPYTETVQRALRSLFEQLQTIAVTTIQVTPAGSFDPDANGNDIGLQARDGDYPYQGGSYIDAIVATGTPAAVAQTGNADVKGRSYAQIVQDMVDAYAHGQTDGTTSSRHGGWRYSWYNNSGNGTTDNSANQWAAIGLLAAERNFGTIVPPEVKANNVAGTINSTQATNGVFGYTSTSAIWGPYATTPSGMVQMAWNGIGRGDNRWDLSEGYMRSNFCNTGSAGSAVRSYYYGLFSFTKSMLLHDSDGDQVSEPIDCLGGDLDWYGAQAGQPDACNGGAPAPCDGVARTLVDDQHSSGYWNGHNFDGRQYPFETAWAIIMLNRTVFESGQPVAVCGIVPSPSVAGQPVDLDGTASFHQDAGRILTTWEWDVLDDGTVDFTGPVASGVSLPAVVGDYPVRLTVTDDASPPQSDDTVCVARVATPPIAPTADADGPYVLCPQTQPWFLDGTGSVNPDEGQSEPGLPGDTIQSYEWDLDGDSAFDDATGSQPDVTAFFSGLGVGDYLVQLRVTDTTGTSFPSSGMGDLSDTDAAQVLVKDAGDAACDCVDDLAARPKWNKIQLRWSSTGAPSYNVYRSTVAGGPYSLVGNVTNQFVVYVDRGLTTGTTYHYVVRPVTVGGTEACQSNEVSAAPRGRGDR